MCTPLCVVLLLAALLPPLPARAELTDEVAEGLQHELAKQTKYPWYSDGEAEPRPVILSPTRQPDTPQSWDWWDRWFKRRSPTVRPWNWGGFGAAVGEILRVLAWIALGALVLYMLFLINQARKRHVRGSATSSPDEVDEAWEAARIENLPIELNTRKVDLLKHAQALYERGDLEQAMVYLFSYQLVTLDKGAWLQLERGKTNRQYLRELQQHPDLKAILAQTTKAFEDVFFGNHPLGRPRFEQIWAQLDQFHQLVAPQTTG